MYSNKLAFPHKLHSLRMVVTVKRAGRYKQISTQDSIREYHIIVWAIIQITAWCLEDKVTPLQTMMQLAKQINAIHLSPCPVTIGLTLSDLLKKNIQGKTVHTFLMGTDTFSNKFKLTC